MERFTTKIIIEKGFQKKMFSEIISKEKLSQRKLAKMLKVSRSGLRHWMNEERKLPQLIFERILKLFPWTITYKNYFRGILPRNWVQIKGGKIRSKMKINLTKEDRIKGFKKAKIKMHRRKVIGPNGELMYNNNEKKIAEELVRNKIRYEYEPIISLGKNYAVPDFVVGNIIIERCGFGNWKPYWSNFKRKVKRLQKYKKKYKIVVLVPSNYFKIVVKKLCNTKNITIFKEENLELLLDFIRAHGPITTLSCGHSSVGRAIGS